MCLLSPEEIFYMSTCDPQLSNFQTALDKQEQFSPTVTIAHLI